MKNVKYLGTLIFETSKKEKEAQVGVVTGLAYTQYGGDILPIEVKSGKYRSHASLDKFSTKFADRIGERIILYTKDVAERDGVIHLPIYMAMFL